MYLKNDSYVWQCEKEIRHIVEMLKAIPKDKLIPPSNPIIVEFLKWKQEKHRELVVQLVDIIQAPTNHPIIINSPRNKITE